MLLGSFWLLVKREGESDRVPVLFLPRPRCDLMPPYHSIINYLRFLFRSPPLQSALESLLAADYKPRRTIVFASGQDEESSGHHGAKYLGEYLEKTYGTKGFSLLVDEGGGDAEMYGRLFALPATAEKGLGDLRVTVETLGGHS